jgi:dihydroorotate dehydrogenase (NAD+) catalytic subunit
VQIGTANFFDPTLSGRILDALPGALKQQGLDDVNQLIGTLEVAPAAAAVHKPSVPV